MLFHSFTGALKATKANAYSGRGPRRTSKSYLIHIFYFRFIVKMSYSGDLADGLQKLRGSQKFCDVVLIAEDTEFYCHKVVLSALSEFFDTMFDSSFKVCLHYYRYNI